MIMAILLVSFLAVSAVSAAENATGDIVGMEEATDEVVSIEENHTILQDSNVGTFTDLANEIAKAKSELNLNRNYIYSNGDSDYNHGIIIDKKITINGNGFEINGNNQARAFNINAGSVVLNDISFVNCAVSSSSSSISGCAGGAIYWAGSNGKLVNCNFVNSSSYSDSHCSNSSSAPVSSYSYSSSFSFSCGGAVYWSGSNGKLVNCNFVNSSSYSDSYSRDYSYSYHTENHSSCYSYGSSTDYSISYGGAVYWCGSNGELVDCSFVNSSSFSSSISVVSVSSSTTDSEFGYSSKSNSTSHGGAVYFAVSNVALVNCRFVNSSSYGESSSTVYCYNPRSSYSFSSGSSCSSEGGAVYFYGDDSVLANCSFVNCSSFGSSSGSGSDHSCSGGAVYLNGNKGILSNCSFVDCLVNSTYSSGGGAIYLYGDDGVLTNCSFAYCISKDFGGAICGGEGLVKDSIFIGNSAVYQAGGAIEWGGSAVNCIFINNDARYGGAILSGDAVNCIFINNSVRADGGAACHVYAVNCTFINNDARYGGAISGYSIAKNCTFINNSATDNGGAIHLSEGSAVNCTFQYNRANRSGGAICSSCNYYSTNNFKNCIFVNNIADEDGGAIFVLGYGGCYVVNCNFQNNHAERYAGAMYKGSGENLIFKRNTAGVEGNDTYETQILKSVLSLSDFTTTYKSGDKMPINFTTSKDVPITDADVKVSVYKDDALIGTYHCLSGDGWVVDLDVGNYVAVASVDSRYLTDSANATVTVNKAKTKITSQKTTVSYNDDSKLIATLTNALTGNAIANTNIVFKINDVKHTVKTDSKGQAKLSLNGLNPNEYAATISYAGNSKYSSSTRSVKVIVNKADTSISATANNNEVVATLTHAVTGKAISGAKLVANINGKSYDLKTDSKGQVIFTTGSSISTATVSYAGNAKYNPSSVTVNTKANIIISAVYDSENNELVATLTNGDTGKAVTSATVQVNINGATTTAKTDTKGQAKISTVGLPLGTNTATFLYAGNSKYNPANTSISFDVKTKVIITDVYGYSDKLVATLTNGATGKPIVNAYMEVEINGATYTAKSDSKSQISIDTSDLGLTKYDVTITYGGNSRYTPSSATVAIDLNKANMNIKYSYNADTKELVATLKNSKTGKVVSSANMVVDINGVKTTLKSNSKGQIIFSTADFTPGTHVGTITYGGNDRYNSISAAFKVDV